MTDFEEQSGSAFLASMRRAHDPPGDAKQRVRAAVLASLPLTVPPAGPAPTTAASAPVWTSLVGFAGTAVVVLGISIGAFYMLRSSTQAVPARAPRVVVTTPPSELSATVEDPVSSAVEAVPSEPISARASRLAATSSAHASPPGSTSLAREVELVRAAHIARENGDPTTALARLASHRRDFPRGMLVEEREVETVLALCALGRTDEARARASAFEATFPSSAHAGRVAASCAASSERSRHEPAIDRALTP